MNLKLKEIRQKKGFSQQQIAEVLGITQASYSHYENRRRQPEADALCKLAEFYKITIDELVGHEVPYQLNKSQFSDDQLALIEEIKELDSYQCLKVLAYIDGLKDGKKEREAIIQKLRGE